ncbi:MAG TPA: flagellar hook basal-body protein, partial [bacterium]|nr:flagellar hook basal-body protein [bacterium]
FRRMADAAKEPLSVPEVQTRTDFTAGPPIVTQRPLDLSLDGAGFFAVSTNRGERYTRVASLSVDADGMLRDSTGNLMLGEHGMLFVGDKPVFIDSDGVVTVDDTVLDRLKLVSFVSGDQLVNESGGLYAAQGGAVPDSSVERPYVNAGQLEGSSVEPVSELVQMITALRSYEAAAAAVHSTDRTVELAVNEIAKV